MALTVQPDETASTDREAVPAQLALALQHHQAGRLEAAAPLYRRILALDSRHDESLHLLGVIACQCGRAAEAVPLIEQAIALRSHVAAYHYNLGLALERLDRGDAAIRAFERAVALHSGYVEAHNNLAALHLTQGRFGAAIAGFESALALKPDHVEACFNLGIALLQQGSLEPAIARFEQTLALRPNYAEAWYRLGCVLDRQGRLDDAASCLGRATALRPDHAEAWYARGSVQHRRRRPDDAESCYRQAIALKPDDAAAYGNLALLLKDRGDLTAASALLDRALALQPDFADAQFNQAMIRLLAGDFAAGWRQYEWRWRTRQLDPDRRTLSMPLWNGSAGNGRTMLLWAEQGLGDTLQFCRYAPLVAARGWQVVLEVPPTLVRLLQSLPGVSVCAIGAGATADCHCPVMSLPWLFGTSLDTVPAATPYLAATPAGIALWRPRLAGDGFKVGLAWAGNPGLLSAMHEAVDTRRSIPLGYLAPLLDVDGVRFVSLQKARRPGETPAEAGMLDLMDEVRDFADTAAIVAQLDLVISVDTAVVHLAGALGKPVWLLNRFDPCWRWLLDRGDSPWYPGLRQFRQAAPGNWRGPIMGAVAALEASAGRRQVGTVF
jgi:tetratricopeptide (TPR) repeat protein